MAIRKIISRSIGVDVIAAEDLAAGSVETAEIQNGAVTGPKLADNLNYDSGTLYLDSTNNRVGIGITSPSSALHILDTSTPQAKIAYDSNRYMNVEHATIYNVSGAGQSNNLKFATRGNSGNNEIIFSTGGTDAAGTGESERMRIDSNGNVGLGGEADPSSFLHLKKSDATTYNATATDGQVGIGPTIYLENPANSNITVGGQIVFGMRSTESQARIGATGGANPELTFGTNDAERMRIDSSGNVAIGSSDPGSNKLKVSANNAGNAFTLHQSTGNIEAYAQGTSANATNLQTTTKHVLLQSYFDNGGRQWNQGAQLMLSNAHYATGTPHCRLVLNTSQGGYNNGGMIHAEGAGNYNAGSLVFSTGWDSDSIPDEIFRICSNRMLIGTGNNNLPSASVFGAGFDLSNYSELRCSTGGTGNSTQIRFLNPNGEVGAIRTNGTATNYITSSDYRLKENVTTDWDATTRIKQLNPVRFNFISDADTTVDGFLAHEVQTVVPEAISGTKDGMVDEEFEVTPAVDATWDDDGNVLTEAVPAVMETRSVPEYQGIDQSKLVPLLVKSLQEALTEIDSLKARLDDAGL